MRKIILATLILGIFCSSVYAVNILNLFRRNEAQAIRNAAEVRAILQSLAPTEAEAKAHFDFIVNQWTPGHTPSDIPVTQDPDAQVAIEVRYLSFESPLAEMVLTKPAMNWSMIITAEPKMLPEHSREHTSWCAPFATMTPGTAWSGTYTYQPIYVRFLDDSNAEKLIRMTLSQRTASVMEAPKIVLKSGQPGMINDTTKIPFVEGVVPFNEFSGGKHELQYAPAIRHIPVGQTLAIQGTILQDDSVRLDRLYANFTTVKEVRKVKLLDDQNGNTVTVQVPSIASFRISIPEIVIPKGMSLLVAMPGMNEKGEVFLLITPKVVERPAEMATGHSGYSVR